MAGIVLFILHGLSRFFWPITGRITASRPEVMKGRFFADKTKESSQASGFGTLLGTPLDWKRLYAAPGSE